MGIVDFALRLLAAQLLGASIGLERHWRQRNAGLRTNTLVSLGAAAFILLAIEIGGDATGRIASYIVSGIGFLGAGVIMKDGLNVQGLNTAATIWCSAAVGALSGMGLFPQAAVLTITIMLTHIMLRPLGIQLNKISFIKTASVQTGYLFTITCKMEVENHIRIMLMKMLENEEKTLLRSLSSDDHGSPSNAIIKAEIRALSQQDSLMERVASRLTIEDKVKQVSWEIVETVSEL